MHVRQFTNTFYPVYLSPDPESIPRRQRRTIQIWLIGVCIAVKRGIDRPLDKTESGPEPRRESIADGIVEVVAKYKVVAIYRFGEGDCE